MISTSPSVLLLLAVAVGSGVSWSVSSPEQGCRPSLAHLSQSQMYSPGRDGLMARGVCRRKGGHVLSLQLRGGARMSKSGGPAYHRSSNAAILAYCMAFAYACERVPSAAGANSGICAQRSNRIYTRSLLPSAPLFFEY